jgi:molybdopterin/thiamine biosynthesis adenylyltransferase
VGADLALVVDDAELACVLPVTLPRLAIFTPTDRQPCRVVLALPGEKFALLDLAITKAIRRQPSSRLQASRKVFTPNYADCNGWDWQTAAPLVALAARSLLLQGTPFAMATWEDAWARGVRAYCVGGADDPTRAMWEVPVAEAGQTGYRTPLARRGTLLIVGLGSLGSVAALALAPWVARLVLVDPDSVETANLVRQAYAHRQLGEAKASALAEVLRAAHPGLVCESVVASLVDESQVEALIHGYGVSAALVTMGTDADFAIARALRAEAIPHVVGRCYGRARFWEGIVVDGDVGPSYEQVRRQVAAGPTPAPTPEEMAAYGAVGELVGEPATAMECGWAAMWLARLMAQMLAPTTLREGWLLARLAADATCFVGGLVVEQSVDDVGQSQNGVAYGVTVPGAVHAWSVAEIR